MNTKIELAYAILSDGVRSIAVCPHLNIVGFGKTDKEAEEDFEKAVHCFIKFHEKNNNLDAKLISLGWKIVNHVTSAPENFSVPTHLLSNSRVGSLSRKQFASYA